jgi:hypothetical protein
MAMSALTLGPDRQFRQQVRRIHACGPRPVGELPGGILARLCPQCRDLVHEQVERYTGMDPDVVRWCGGRRDWIEPRAVICLVVGGRP